MSYFVALQKNFMTEEEVACPICFDYVLSCRVAICGHIFCNQCLSECLLRKKVLSVSLIKPFRLARCVGKTSESRRWRRTRWLIMLSIRWSQVCKSPKRVRKVSKSTSSGWNLTDSGKRSTCYVRQASSLKLERRWMSVTLSTYGALGK